MTLADVAADAVALSVPGAPRLRLEPTSSGLTLLDGGWWPRSVDPAAELPGLVLAIDRLRGPVIRLVLNAAGWDPHPRRLEVAGRIRRLGYFTSQPAALLTARCDNGQRVDLLVVPPGTARRLAEAAMALAATASNRIHAPSLLAAARARPTLPEPTARPNRSGTAKEAGSHEQVRPRTPAPRRSARHEAKRPDKP